MAAMTAKADGCAVVARMKAMPTDDDCFSPGQKREDGRALHPCYLLEAKKSSEANSSGMWRGYWRRARWMKHPAPSNEGGCPLVKA
jgi:branched-chain amino acid transport system substrate-binding protein